MRNYIETVWTNVKIGPPGPDSHGGFTFVGADTDDIVAQINAQLAVSDPGDVVQSYWDVPDFSTRYDDFHVDEFYLKLSKERLLELMKSVSSSIAFDDAHFFSLFVPKSPRKKEKRRFKLVPIPK